MSRMPVNPLQEVICCLGQPVAGNPSQYLMEKAFVASGLDWRFLTLEVAPAALEDAIKGIKALGFRGANISMPHKAAVIPLLDSLTPMAKQMGAVNFVHCTADQKLEGDNTEGAAALLALREQGGDPTGKKVVLFGAGSFGRAMAVELAKAGAREFVVLSRTLAHGEALVNTLSQDLQVPATLVHWKGNYELPEDADLVINATSLGHGDPNAKFPLVEESLKPSMLVLDAIYDPPTTWLVRAARERECPVVDGFEILIRQVAIDFGKWTGQQTDVAMLRDAAEEFLGV